MQLIVDFLPVVVFFVVYKLTDIYMATAAIMIAMTLQIAVQWIRTRTVSKMLLVSGALVVVLGAITLGLRNPIFLQWKPTVVNWLFALAFLVSHFVGQQPLIQRMLGHAVELPAHVWRQLNFMWIANFMILGAANLYVVYNFSEEAWVNFKVYGMIGITLLMVLAQGLMIHKHLQAEEQGEP
jgi:intracellular septation protein